MRIEPSDAVVQATTATQLIVGRPCVLQGLILTPAAASCTVTLYDPAPLAVSPITQGVATTVGATARISLAGAAAGGSVTAAISGSGIAFKNGVIAVVSGAGSTATVITATI